MISLQNRRYFFAFSSKRSRARGASHVRGVARIALIEKKAKKIVPVLRAIFDRKVYLP